MNDKLTTQLEEYRQLLLDKARDEGWGKFVKIETNLNGVIGYHNEFQTLKRSDFYINNDANRPL